MTEQTPKKRGRPSNAELKERLRTELRTEIMEEIKGDLRELKQEMRKEIEAELREELAKEQEIPEWGPSYDLSVDLDAPDSITIHFIEDGFTAWGKVWFRGEEVTIRKGTREWRDECNWFLMGELEQLDKFGRVRWRPGPWRGKGFDLNDPALSDADRQRLLSIQREREERNKRSGF